MKKLKFKYETARMTVSIWGRIFHYQVDDVLNIPEHVRYYCLKGFAGTLKAHASVIKRRDFAKNGRGKLMYRQSCLDLFQIMEENLNRENEDTWESSHNVLTV